MSCRVCSGSLITVFSIKSVPFSGIFPKPSSLNDVTYCDLELGKCKSCGLVQLRSTLDPSYMYGDNYGYRSGLNDSMVATLKSNIDYCQELVDLAETDLVVDIASNDGTSLSLYNRDDISKHGVDPTAAKFAKY